MRANRVCGPLALVALMLVASCAVGPTRQETAAALDQVLAGAHRSPENRARDAYRHPRETLLFFGLRPQQAVAEIWPGDGWYTEIIAPLLRDHGEFRAVEMARDPGSRYITGTLNAYESKVSRDKALYGNVILTSLGPDGKDFAPPGSLDMILTFRNLHNWMAEGWAAQAFAAMHRALKPGGTLGIVEHRANPALPVDEKAKSGYVNESYAIALIEKAGFQLVAKSEINANPLDTKDYEQGVWTLPPTYRLGDRDREKYAAIGESDRFTLKFVKPPAGGR